MPPVLFADNFLAGSILTLVMPIGLVVAIAIWYLLAVRHVPEDTPTSSASLPPPEVVAAAPPSESGVRPAERRPGDS